MATIKIRWTVAELDNVLTQFDVERVYRSTTGINGTYSIIGTVPLVAGQEDYYFDDTSGDTSYFYKTSHYHTGTLNESNLSQAYSVASAQDPALQVITVDELKTLYLFGLDLTNDEGEPMPDSLYEHFIASSVAQLEHELDLPILTKNITDERHDYYREDYDKWIWVKLDEYPLLEVTQIQMVMPGEQIVHTFDQSWIHEKKALGQVQVIPGSGGAAQVLFLASGNWLPFLYGRSKFIPDVFRFNYSAGFDPIPADIKDAVGKMASFGPLNIAGDLLGGAGIASQSIGIDGLSQTFNTTSSATNAGYGARLLQYQKELKKTIPILRRYYKGISLQVV